MRRRLGLLAAVTLMVVGCSTEAGQPTVWLTPAPSVTAPPPGSTIPGSKGRDYPWHTNITATTFWVGELYQESLADGSQVCSTYDGQWAFRWSGVNKGRVPASAPGCAGSIWGGCDGRVTANTVGGCAVEARSAANDYLPTSGLIPLENHFYLDLPYDDVNDPIGFAQRCQVIPWANDPGYAGKCKDKKFSYMKNRWVEVTRLGRTCYGQIEDAGPSSGDEYHDAAYVFGANDARPKNKQWGNAGMDASPALSSCLGFPELDGTAKVNWRFVDFVDVPPGPWRLIVTTSQVNW